MYQSLCQFFCGAEIGFIFFPFLIQQASLLADVVLGGNVALISKSVLLFSQ